MSAGPEFSADISRHPSSITRMICGALVGVLLSGCASTPRYEQRYQPVATMDEADRKACEEYAAAEAEAWKDDPREQAAFYYSIGTMFGTLVLIPVALVAIMGHLYDVSQQRESYKAQAMDRCLAPAVLAQTHGPDHPVLVWRLLELADRQATLGRLPQAESLYQRAFEIAEKAPETERSTLESVLARYAALLRRMGKDGDAQELEARAQAIRRAIAEDEKAREEAIEEYRRGYIHALSGNYAEAELLYQRALRIDHIYMTEVLEAYADLLRKTNRGPEAAELEIRAKEIRKRHERHDPASRTRPDRQ